MERTLLASFMPNPIPSEKHAYYLSLYEDELVIGFDPEPLARVKVGATIAWRGELRIPVEEVDFADDKGGLFTPATILFFDRRRKSDCYLARYGGKDRGPICDFLQAIVDRQKQRRLEAEKAERLRAAAAPDDAAAGGGAKAGGGGGSDIAGQLAGLAALHAEGALSDAEFAAAKGRILG